MNKDLFTVILVLSLAFGQYRSVTAQKKFDHDDSVEQKTEINIISEGDRLKVTINKDGEEREFTVDRHDR